MNNVELNRSHPKAKKESDTHLDHKIQVSCPGGNYAVLVTTRGLAYGLKQLNLNPLQRIMIVTNETVAPLYLQQVLTALSDFDCETVIIPDGEQYKNQETVELIYQALLQKQFNRDGLLIALGGGVVGDMTGYVASTYLRGVPFIQIPTTLLAQIDAAIGGKTGINRPEGKNLIGTFYQPQAVLIALDTLLTLAPREFKAGLGEMIKYGLLVGGSFYSSLKDWLHGDTQEIDTPKFAAFIAQCCQIKADYVSRDEREQGVRALLNLGHTFAHALENYTLYQKWLHGEAVAIGLYCAVLLSQERGLVSRKFVAEIANLIDKAGLPRLIPAEIDCVELIHKMGWDKKIKAGRLRFILVRNPGDCYLEDAVREEELHRTLIKAVRGE